MEIVSDTFQGLPQILKTAPVSSFPCAFSHSSFQQEKNWHLRKDHSTLCKPDSGTVGCLSFLTLRIKFHSTPKSLTTENPYMFPSVCEDNPSPMKKPREEFQRATPAPVSSDYWELSPPQTTFSAPPF